MYIFNIKDKRSLKRVNPFIDYITDQCEFKLPIIIMQTAMYHCIIYISNVPYDYFNTKYMMYIINKVCPGSFGKGYLGND